MGRAPRQPAVAAADVQIAVLAGRKPNEHLARWMRQFPDPWVSEGAPSRAEIPAARNAIVRRYLAVSPRPWLWMLDDDVVPIAATAELLLCPSPVAGARIVSRTGLEAHPHCLSAACLKVRRDVLEAVGDPWFRYPRAGGCECSWFFHRACCAGFRAVKAGVVGHRFRVVVLPGPSYRLDAEIRTAALDAGL